jgi:hypothetical protein
MPECCPKLELKPVTFRYKKEVDPDRAPQFGSVAEDVEKVDRELVLHDEQGKPFTVRYEAVNARKAKGGQSTNLDRILAWALNRGDGSRNSRAISRSFLSCDGAGQPARAHFLR